MQDKDIFGQFGKPERLTLSWSTFWKIVLAMALSCLILLGIYLGFRYLTQSQSDPARQEADLQKQAARVLRQLEDALFAEWDASAKAIDQAFPAGIEINESVLRKWMDEQTNLLSVGIQVKDSFPVQFVPDRFWESELVRKLPETERQKLLQFIFPDQDRLSAGTTLIHISSVVNPLVRVIWKSSINERKYVFIQELTPLDPLFSQILPSKIRFALADTDEITLAGNRDIVPREESEEWIRSEIRSARLGWKLTLEEPVKSGLASGILSNPFFLPVFVFILFIFFAVIAYTITRWIDSPMGPLYETAMRISRGDFSLRLPGSSSKKGNRLARLINYMVEEMDHLQKINVSKIIVEKRKTETILKNIADAVIVTDNADRILVLNAVAEKWFDCLESVTVRQGLSQILKESTLIQMIQNVREKGQPDSAEFQVRILGYAQPRTLHAHGAPVKSQDGRKIGVVTVIRDVSEERGTAQNRTGLHGGA
jgi:PAS domain S-box-containing protein